VRPFGATVGWLSSAFGLLLLSDVLLSMGRVLSPTDCSWQLGEPRHYIEASVGYALLAFGLASWQLFVRWGGAMSVALSSCLAAAVFGGEELPEFGGAIVGVLVLLSLLLVPAAALLGLSVLVAARGAGITRMQKLLHVANLVAGPVALWFFWRL